MYVSCIGYLLPEISFLVSQIHGVNSLASSESLTFGGVDMDSDARALARLGCGAPAFSSMTMTLRAISDAHPLLPRTARCFEFSLPASTLRSLGASGRRNVSIVHKTGLPPLQGP